MFKIYRLYDLDGTNSSMAHKSFVTEFDSRGTVDFKNLVTEEINRANRQAKRDMFAYMKQHKGVYTYRVLYVS